MKNDPFLGRLCAMAAVLGMCGLACGGTTPVPADGGARIADAGKSTDSGGATVPANAIAAGCRPKVTTVASAYPAANDVKIEAGSSVKPALNGGTLVDGTYFLVARILRANGTMDSIESAVLVINGSQIEYLDAIFMNWAASVANESASAGPVVLKDGYLDTSGMVPCWGTGQLDKFIPYSATATEIVLRLGSVDYTFVKQ